MSLAVIDTHALLWAATGQKRRLGRAALRLIDQADQGRAALYVPTVCLVEVAEAERRGAIRLHDGFDRWVDALFSSGRFHPVDLTTSIVKRAHELYAIPERGDRLIAATAVELNLPLLTRDPEVAEAAGVDAIW